MTRSKSNVLTPLFTLILLIAAATIWAQPPSSPEPMSGKTAKQFFADNNITAGWNLGNTMDAVNTSTTGTKIAVESDWIAGKPAATQALFTGVVADSKFDIIRIPVSWIGHIGPAPDYTISAERMNRVTEIVNYGKTAGVKAMIINIHHDGNAGDVSGGGSTWGFVDLANSVNNTAKKDQVEDQLKKVWTQIANHFKNYGDYLIFETLNEVHTGNWGSPANTDAFRKQQDILFDWNSAALSAIRATGGNNAKRFVAVPALGSTEPSYVINAHSRQRLLPNDPGNGNNNLIVSVHYYHPASYTVVDNIVHTWGSTAERRHPRDAMDTLKTTFLDNGIAVYVGEWGAPNYKRVNESDAIKSTHIDYLTTVATAARASGIVPIFWDDGGNFRLLSRQTGKPQAGFYTDIYTAIMSVLKGAPIIVDPPEIPSGDTVRGEWIWGKYDDQGAPNNGTSTITLTPPAGSTVTASGTVTDVYEHRFAGFDAIPDDAATLDALTKAVAISFKVKSDGKTYKVILPTSDIEDHCQYMTTFTTTNGVETTVTLRISDFEQPDWGVQKEFNQSLVDRIQFQTDDGALGAYSFTISDLTLIKAGTSSVLPQGVASVKRPGLLQQRGKVITSDAPIQLYTLKGRRVAATSAKGPKSLVTLNLSRIPNGVYIAKSGAHTLRVQVQR